MKINDLALGKWYSTIKGGYMKPLILMTFKLKADCINIRCSKGQEFSSNIDVLNSSWWEDAKLLTDLTEIQSYLPEGHIDKKSIALIKDNWYTGEGNEKWLFKYNGFQQGFSIVGMSKCCSIPSGDRTISAGSLQNIKNVQLANLEEVYKHFPEEKPKGLTNKDMQIGELYKYDKHLILRFKGIKVNGPYLSITMGSFNPSSSWNFSIDSIELPSEDERRWYLACEQANKFIPKEEALKSTSMEPIIGNWYKLVNGRSTVSSNWLIKFNGWPGNTLNSTLAICEGKAYGSNSNFGTKGYYNLEPVTDMSIVYREYPDEKPKETILSSLPEKWQILRNNENANVINKWFEDIGAYYGLVNGRGYAHSMSPEGKVLTTEEFYTKIGKTMEKKETSLVGRYVKVVDNTAIVHYNCKIGDYLKFHSMDNGLEYWGNDRNDNITPWYFGYRAHENSYFELQPIGFTPPKKEENLVGRWLKALIDHPSAGVVKKGEYGKIIKDGYCSDLIVDFPSQSGYNVSKLRLDDTSRYELMPEGFIPPNKEESKFVAGKWYLWINKGSSVKDHYLKLEKIQGEYVYFSEKIHGRLYSETNDKWLLKDEDYYYIQDCSLEEIQQFLPVGHPDKFPEKPSIMQKFKIGDKVRCIGDKCIDGGWAKGLEFTINNLTSGTIEKGQIAWGTPSGGGVYFINLELITSSIPEYLECRNNKGYSNPFTIGKVYKVISITGDDPRLKDDNDKEISIYRGLNHPNPEKECTCFILSNYSAYLAQNYPKILEEDRIFEEAKKRYPVGTKFKIAFDSSRSPCTVKSHDRYKITSHRDMTGKLYINLLVDDAECEGANVYFDGKWGEIVEYPKIYDGRLIQEMKDFSKYYNAGIDPYDRKRDVELLSLQENGGMIDPSVKSTKSIKKELVGEQEVVLF